MSNKLHTYFYVFCCLFLLLQSCSVSRQINKQAHTILIQDSVINTGHIGISIYEPSTNSYWYNYNAEKYFVPASNTKLFTLYAGMKYLGDSLVGLRYYDWGSDFLEIRPSADPTFLHPAFKKQPVFDFLYRSSKNLNFNGTYWKDEHKGSGWAWDDYNEVYMTQKSSFPIYGNLVKVFFDHDTLTSTPYQVGDIPIYAEDWWEYPKNKQLPRLHKTNLPQKFSIKKTNQNYNNFGIYSSGSEFVTTFYPRVIYDEETISILNDTIKPKTIAKYILMSGGEPHKPVTIHSQPTDSLLTPMMHNSDNFFAEQTLLMVSNEHLGYMNDEAIIDTLLKTDLNDIPQQPRWVDGSGLSRYNLFTPQSFVYILNKMKNEIGLERLKTILPTGGEGTLKNYYTADSSFIYAKTGSLSNQIALSGFIITKKSKLLTFSILANNVMGDGWKVRRAIEHFVKNIREQY